MKRFAYLDIEANHTNWHDAQIIEVAFIIKDEDGKDLDYFQSLIKPKGEINPEITQLTGITQQMLNNAPELHKIAQKIHDKLEGCIIVAHKISFDYEILNKELIPLNLTLKNKKVCTLEMSQRLIPGLKSYSLKALCSLIQVKLKNHHRALDDALALFHLYMYLRMINGELTIEDRFLPEHKKLIEKAPKRPGMIIIIGFKKETFKTDNLNKKLKELLAVCPNNRERISAGPKVKFFQSGSLIKAGLMQAKHDKPIYSHCVYKVKDSHGRIFLRVGKTNIKKKALYYTKSKKEALKLVSSLIKNNQDNKLVFQDQGSQQSEVVKSNIELTQKLKKIIALEKNYLIRSTDLMNGKYQYTLIKGNHSFANFESAQVINKSDDIVYSDLKFKKIRPREYMSLNHSLMWIKNQKNKTDVLFEVKNK
jgi:DNA polymerase III epsilon subunit family exonuclease